MFCIFAFYRTALRCRHSSCASIFYLFLDIFLLLPFVCMYMKCDLIIAIIVLLLLYCCYSSCDRMNLIYFVMNVDVIKFKILRLIAFVFISLFSIMIYIWYKIDICVHVRKITKWNKSIVNSVNKL